MSYESFLTGQPATNPLDAAIDRIHSLQTPAYVEPVTPVIDVQPITWEAWQRLNDLQARIEAFGTLDASIDDPDDVNAVLAMQKDALALASSMLEDLRDKPCSRYRRRRD